VKGEETRTGIGDNADDTVVVVPDMDKRGTRLCGRRSRDADEGVDEDSELCVVLRELDVPELFPEAEDEDRVGIPPWKCKWRCTGAWRANKSLIIVLSASLSRTPFGRICFLTGDGVSDGGDCCNVVCEQGGTGTKQGYSRGQKARPAVTGCLAGAARSYW
jgi:hypothetical protein